MKDVDMPKWLKKRDGSIPILTTWEMGMDTCPKCKHKYKGEAEKGNCKPDFSEWEHFIWCDFCKEQFPSMLWYSKLQDREKKFLDHINPEPEASRGEQGEFVKKTCETAGYRNTKQPRKLVEQQDTPIPPATLQPENAATRPRNPESLPDWAENYLSDGKKWNKEHEKKKEGLK